MTFEEWWAKEFSNVNIHWYENSSDALTKEWFNIVKQAFEDGKSAALAAKDARIAELESENSHLRHGMTGDYDLDAWLEWCSQKDATPYEDGGDEREQFEAAATAGGVYACNFERYTELTAAHENKVNGDIKRVEVGDYRSATLQDGWKLWQLAKADVIEKQILRYMLEPCYRQDVANALYERAEMLRNHAEQGIETTFL